MVFINDFGVMKDPSSGQNVECFALCWRYCHLFENSLLFLDSLLVNTSMKLTILIILMEMEENVLNRCLEINHWSDLLSERIFTLPKIETRWHPTENFLLIHLISLIREGTLFLHLFCSLVMEREILVPRSLSFKIQRVFLVCLLALTSIGAAIDLQLILNKASSDHYGPASLRIIIFLVDVLSVTLCLAGLCFARVNFLWAFITLDAINFVFSLVLSALTTFWWGAVSLGFSFLSWIFAFCIIREINMVRNSLLRDGSQIGTVRRLWVLKNVLFSLYPVTIIDLHVTSSSSSTFTVKDFKRNVSLMGVLID